MIIFFISACSVYSQPVASEGDGLLFLPELAVATTSAVATRTNALPFFLDEQPASFPHFPTDPMGASLRIISSLFMVIIIAFAISWFLQKKAGLGGNVFGKVLGILPFDNKRMIYLVDVMGKVLVLGVTESSINLLCEITDKDTLDSLRLQYEKPSPGMEKLFSFLRRGSNSDQTDPMIPEEQEERNQERLRKLNDLLVKRSSKDSNPDNQ